MTGEVAGEKENENREGKRKGNLSAVSNANE